MTDTVFDLIAIGPMTSEGMIFYSGIINYPGCTVKDVVNEIVYNRKEWGYIGIRSDRDNLSQIHSRMSLLVNCDPRIEYDHGVIKGSEFPETIMNKKVKSIIADGGWSRMDYALEVY